MAAQIRIRNATKVFRAHGREVEALRDITFDVPAGQFACLLGPSGCGKSTLLNAVAGFSPPHFGIGGSGRQAGSYLGPPEASRELLPHRER